MKKPLRTLMLLLVCAAAFNSCKKNPDDPGISFRTRKARVAGEWKVESGTIKYGPDGDQIVYTITGNTVKVETNCCIGSGTSSINFSFDKKGQASSSIILSGYVSKWSGTWNFTGGIGDQKKKDQIVVTVTSTDDGSGASTYSGNQVFYTFDIDELRHKKLRMHMSYKVKDASGDDYSYYESWTLIPK
jgi:hypothetical protein